MIAETLERAAACRYTKTVAQTSPFLLSQSPSQLSSLHHRTPEVMIRVWIPHPLITKLYKLADKRIDTFYKINRFHKVGLDSEILTQRRKGRKDKIMVRSTVA
ncbi:MAG TPA: hypothetical protein VNO70_02850 [Blastocatellia bacterium]|nr:hypothetical protein [Blastocatellia bacterium]